METAIGLLIAAALLDTVVRFYARLIRGALRLGLAAAQKVRAAR